MKRLLLIAATVALAACASAIRHHDQNPYANPFYARYLKTVLADEILLNTPWCGRERWTAYLLESTLFRTNVAGDLVFSRIEQLLSDREPSRRDPDAAVEVRAFGVGAAVVQRLGHAPEPVGVDGAADARDPADPAHAGQSTRDAASRTGAARESR